MRYLAPMKRLFAVIVCLSATACALRPVYRDVVGWETGPEVTRQLVDAQTRKPLAGVQIEMGEYKNKWVGTTQADGTFKLPVQAKYSNEMLVIAIPRGVDSVAIVTPQLPPPPPPVPLELDGGAELDAGAIFFNEQRKP